MLQWLLRGGTRQCGSGRKSIHVKSKIAYFRGRISCMCGTLDSRDSAKVQVYVQHTHIGKGHIASTARILKLVANAKAEVAAMGGVRRACELAWDLATDPRLRRHPRVARATVGDAIVFGCLDRIPGWRAPSLLGPAELAARASLRTRAGGSPSTSPWSAASLLP